VGTVSSIGTNEDWERFFDYIFGGESGYVYSPTKDPETGSFQKYHFQWPQEKAAFFRHIETHTKSREVYYAPALFASRGAEKEDFKGSYFVWCEFDGNAPDAVEGIPEPSLKLQSSTSGHQHWYWKLDGFVYDIDVVESISQKLAYHLGADTGSWNGNRVLRPVGTKHHESGNTVKVLRWDERPSSIADFIGLPDMPIKVVDADDIKTIPLILDVIAKYPWPPEVFKFFKEPTMPKGSRTSALTKLGHFCMELGMTNAETLAVFYHADERWGKFKNRNDRKRRLVDLINYCRARHPVNPVGEEVENRFKVYTFEEFQNTDFQLEWLLPDLLHKKGLFIIGGPPRVGKSQTSLRFAEKMAKCQSFLRWEPTRPIRTLFISMEMPGEELKHFMDIMQMEDTNGLLKENLLIMPLGHSIGLKHKDSQTHLNKVMEKYQPDIVMMDSLGVAISDDMSSDKIVLDTFKYVNESLRNEFGAAVWFIHHPRKEQIGNKKPNKLDDLYGNRYISAAVTSAINLWPVGDEIEVSCLKMRMVKEFQPFRIRRSPTLEFEISSSKMSKDAQIFHADQADNVGMSDGGMVGM